MDIQVRYAKREDLDKINELRKMVNDIHVEKRPDIFRAGFVKELKDYIYELFENEKSDIIVATVDGDIAGFVASNHVYRSENPYNIERKYYHIEELAVSDNYRRMGIATMLIEFCRNTAAVNGFDKIELDVWEFNQSAIKFYGESGFKTYRRFMEIDLNT